MRLIRDRGGGGGGRKEEKKRGWGGTNMVLYVHRNHEAY